MILVILVAIAFYKYAKKNNLNPIFWSISSVVCYFGFQIILGLILFFTILDPRDLTKGLEIILNLLGGAIGLGIAYMLMINSAKKNKNKKEFNNELLDDDFITDL